MRFSLEQGLKLKLAVYEVAGRIRLTFERLRATFS
jgi:hypothetical protein